MANMELKRVGVLSSARISGATGAGLGLIIGVIYGLIVMVAGVAILSQSKSAGAGFTILGGLFAIVLIPIFYGILAFIAGALYAFIYNVAAGFVGGLELELESTTFEYAAPPAPSQPWTPNSYQSGQQM